MFSDINVSHGSVAMRLKCGGCGISSYHFTANILLSLTMKNFENLLTFDKVTAVEFGGSVFCNTVLGATTISY